MSSPTGLGEPLHDANAVATRRHTFNARIAIIAFIAISLFAIAKTWPPLPHEIHLRITPNAAAAGATEPIVITGVTGDGDLLVVKYGPDHHAVFSYDAWGAGGPQSVSVEMKEGETHRLDVEMPSLYELPGVSTPPKGLLKLTFDGTVILSEDVSFHRRNRGAVHFGIDPIGGSCAPLFHGTITTVDGRDLRGGLNSYFPWYLRAWEYLTHPLLIVSVLVISAALGLLLPWIARSFPVAYAVPSTATNKRAQVCFAGVAVIAVLAFTYLITDETFSIFYPESFGVFYDYQALGLLHGHLDVPEVALSGEAFFYGGKCYGYFGPTPALLRLPLMLFGVGIGLLSRPMMILEFIACLAGIYAVLRLAAKMRRGHAAAVTAWSATSLLLAAGLGSTLFYLSSRAYIYHEAILCGAAFAIWAGYCTLAYIERPLSRWWIGAVLCGTLAVHARPPIGLFALAFIGVAAAVNLLRSLRGDVAAASTSPSDRRRSVTTHLFAGAASLLGVLSFNGLSYLKFHTIEGCPLRYNVQYSANRLARIDGKQFHASNIRYGADAYLLRPTLRFTPEFPYVATHGPDPNTYAEAKIDMAEPMAGIPYAMTALSVLALVSIPGCWRARPSVKYAVASAWFGVVPAALAMFAAIAVSHRYTADFVPFLIVAGAFGVLALEPISGVLGKAIKVTITLLCVWSVLVTLALTVSFQGEGVWGIPEGTHERYVRWREKIDRIVHGPTWHP